MRLLVENRFRMVPAAADASRRRPRRRSGHLHKTGTEPRHMTGTNAGPAPSGVLTAGHKHCQSFAAVRWWSSCRLCTIAGCSPVWSSSGVAAVCRRPVKVPPRPFGERAFTGLPWMPFTCGPPAARLWAYLSRCALWLPSRFLGVGEDLGLCGPGSSLFRHRRWRRFETVRPSDLGLQAHAGCAASGGQVELPPGSRLCCFVLAFRLLLS